MRYAIVVDLDRCLGCEGCMVACKTENNVSLGQYWNSVLKIGPKGTWPHLSQYFLPVMCQQCTNAPCVNVCPTGASYRDPDTNIVLVDKEKCIGCKYCMMACPYGVRNWNSEEKVVEKCTLCAHLLGTKKPWLEEGAEDADRLPLCVSTCCGSARYFGDLDDPTSAPSKAIAAKPNAVHYLYDAGNHPTTAYLLSDKYAEWQDVVATPTYARYVQ